jgi:hypothetical protein
MPESGPPIPHDAGWDGNLTPGSFDYGYPETDPMMYFGGPVMTAPINVYVIWYGQWSDTSTAPIVQNFISNLGGSPWFKINSLYFQQSGVANNDAGIIPSTSSRRKFRSHPAQAVGVADAGVQDAAKNNSNITDSSDGAGGEASAPGPRLYVDGSVNLVQNITIGYTRGKLLLDSDIEGLVSDAITNKTFPLDPDGAYIVITAPDVEETDDHGDSEFCYDYCGWHDDQFISGVDVKYVFVGDPTGCLGSCTLHDEYVARNLNAPNGDWPADGMVSVIGHELTELSNDPTPEENLSWLDDYGEESADKCAWTFGKPYLTKTGSVANVSLGSRDYMIQQLWVLDNDGGRCDLHQ